MNFRIPKLSSVSKSISEDVERRSGSVDVDDGIECDDDVYVEGPSPKFIHHHVNSYHSDSALVSSSPIVHNKHGRQEEGSGSENEYDLPDSVSQRYLLFIQIFYTFFLFFLHWFFVKK